MTFVNTYLNILSAFIAPYLNEENKIPKEIDDILSNLAIFCCVWSVGAAIEETTRKPFSEFFTHYINGSTEALVQANV